MQLIVMRTYGRSLRLGLRRGHVVVAVAALVVLGLGAGLGGFFLGVHHAGAGLQLKAANLRTDIDRQNASLADLRVESQASVNAVAARMAQLDARLNQLDAMGTQIVGLAGLKASGFDFAALPGEGGPQPASEVPWKLASLDSATNTLEARIWREESELSALEAVLVHRKYKAQTIPRGKPIGEGWISSGFGWRTDPITGEREFHEGFDFAGHEGDPVRAIAAGVVTWAGPRYGYGRLVIVNDGEGYSTYYAHGKKILVQVGSVIKRGDTIALMGETGRATGPHVHLEVHHDGRPVNPGPFVAGKRGG